MNDYTGRNATVSEREKINAECLYANAKEPKLNFESFTLLCRQRFRLFCLL